MWIGAGRTCATGIPSATAAAAVRNPSGRHGSAAAPRARRRETRLRLRRDRARRRPPGREPSGCGRDARGARRRQAAAPARKRAPESAEPPRTPAGARTPATHRGAQRERDARFRAKSAISREVDRTCALRARVHFRCWEVLLLRATVNGGAAKPRLGRISLIELRLRPLEALGVERLDRVGGARDDPLRVVVRFEIGENVVREGPSVAALGAADADAQAEEILRAEVLRNGTQPIVTAETAALARLQPAEVEVALVVHDERRVGLDLEEPRRGSDRPPGLVHVRLRFEQGDTMTVEADLGETPVELRPPGRTMAPRQLLDDHPADVVAVTFVCAPGIAEPHDEQVERRGAFAPTPRQTQRLLLGAGLALLCSRLGTLGSALRTLLLGHALELALLAFLDLFLGLLDTRRHRQRREHGFRIVEEREPFARGEIAETKRVAHRHSADVELEMLGHLHGERFDIHLADNLRERPAFAHARRILGAQKHNRHGRRDRLIEADLLEIDVDELSPQRILLVVLEDRRASRLLAVHHDVEDRVHAAATGEHASQLALGYTERMRVAAAPVEDAWNEALATQPAGFARACLHTRRDFQPDAFTGHFGPAV